MTAVYISLICFLALHLGGAIWFASRVNTRVAVICETLVRMETDIRSLLLYDGKIMLLNQRMDESEKDRGRLWVSQDALRVEMSNVFRQLDQMLPAKK